MSPSTPRKDSADAARAAREAVTLPPITFPEDLPVSARRDDIARAIAEHQVVIVAGETGSGKTTQLPKIALELGRGRTGQIGHTQPRRIAARSVAERIAEELGVRLGQAVGYQVRFTDESSQSSLVKVMTDGILLAQIQRDPDLRAYDTLIIDEAHERSLTIDVLLGYLTRLLPRRPDLKVIITSATIDSERFAQHFASAAGPAPVIEVTGRTYPVDVRYRPLESDKRGEDKDLMSGIVAACDELLAEGQGDILVFLSGEREIKDAADALQAALGPRVTDPRHPRRVELLPLYARLSAAEQHRVFAAHSSRRIVLATNVAETSLTVPGIHYVVDPGTARISRFNKTTKVQRLPIEPISRASAQQRSGRAGRLAPGIAIRLYSQEDFDSRPEFTEPEILRTSLASVLLHMISVGVVTSPDDVATFPFVEPPDTRAIKDGIQLLTDLGAVTQGKGGRTQLTKVGRTLARLPVDPRQARMIVEGAANGVAYEATVIAAALSIQDPRERPAEVRDEADASHRRFATPRSDVLAYLNLWAYLREQQKQLSGNAFRKMCKQEHLHYLRIREWQDLVTQLRQAAREAGLAVHPRKARAVSAAEGSDAIHHVWDEDAIHRSVLAGLITNIGVQESVSPKASEFAHLTGEAKAAAMRKAKKRAANSYLGTRGARFAIQPGSPVAKTPPAAVMAAHLVETNRLWARDVAAIDVAWVEQLAPHLLKRSYSEPHWSAKLGAAVAKEKVTLYGVPLVADRQVLWAKVEPGHARELFIRHALVQGEWSTHFAFWKTNRQLLDQAREIEQRTRTYGLVASDDDLFDFYDERIPDHVVSAAHFASWWKDAARKQPQLLSLTAEVAMPEASTLDLSQFPEHWVQGDLTLPLHYRFEPGAPSDGISVDVPLAVLPRLAPEGFDWLVPGLAHDLATATIRALPKGVRRLLVPAPDVAKAIVARMDRGTPAWAANTAAGAAGVSYRDAFTQAVRTERSIEIPADAWDHVAVNLPSHLVMTFRVVTSRGGRTTEVARSTSLESLQHDLARESQEAVRAIVTVADKPKPQAPGASPKLATALAEVDALTAWPTSLPGGTLPTVIESDAGAGVVVRAYPALTEERGGGKPPRAALRVLASEGDAQALHARGVQRLLLSQIALPVKRITTRWSAQESLILAGSAYRNTEALVDDLQLAAIIALTSGSAATMDTSHVRDLDSFTKAAATLKPMLEDRVYGIVTTVLPALSAARELDAAIKANTSMTLLPLLSELRGHAARLVGEGFIVATPPERLRHLPRYLKAATYRLDKAQDAGAKDSQLAWSIAELEKELDAAITSRRLNAGSPAVAEIRWMLEELRVSLFAQHLGTDGSVSAKRVKSAIAALA